MTSHSTRYNGLLYFGMVLSFLSLLCFILADNTGGIIAWLCVAGVLLLFIVPMIPGKKPTSTPTQNQQRHRRYQRIIE